MRHRGAKWGVFDGCQVTETVDHAKTEENVEKLQGSSEKLVGQDFKW